jgi:pseudaminic acid synthase
LSDTGFFVSVRFIIFHSIQETKKAGALVNRFKEINTCIKPLSIMTPKGVRLVGPGHPAFIIGEMSGNHNHEFERAIELIDIAVEAGVDAVKIQTYTPDTLTIDCANQYFQVTTNENWAGQTLYSLYKTAFTPWDWQPKLKKYAESRNILLFSTPFDETAVDFLEDMNMPLYKVASFEVTHIPLLRKIGATRKPVIISRGLASLEDMELAVKTLYASGTPQVAVLHCVSSYPATHEQMNLRTIPDISDRFSVVSGLSDHSLGLVAPIAAVSLGASVIEKHYTICRADGGPDSGFSLEKNELKELVNSVRLAEASLGRPTYSADKKEIENIVFRRSIFVVTDAAEGDILTEQNVRIIRPGHGLPAVHFDNILGRKLKRSVTRGTPMSWDLLD